ncbi:response regulator transcription factor [Sphingomonas gellani]|nr:helix-turn-helix transcriptional regulator [Sphingomonas gellani]
MDQSSYDSLTERELECLRLVATGRTSKEIALLLGISKHRVDEVVDGARGKLGGLRRTTAARLVIEHEVPASPHPVGGDVIGVADPVRPTPEAAQEQQQAPVAEVRETSVPFDHFPPVRTERPPDVEEKHGLDPARLVHTTLLLTITVLIAVLVLVTPKLGGVFMHLGALVKPYYH